MHSAFPSLFQALCPKPPLSWPATRTRGPGQQRRPARRGWPSSWGGTPGWGPSGTWDPTAGRWCPRGTCQKGSSSTASTTLEAGGWLPAGGARAMATQTPSAIRASWRKAPKVCPAASYIYLYICYILYKIYIYIYWLQASSIEDCQHFGCTVTHSASYMTHYDTQCDSGALADFLKAKMWVWKIFFFIY